MNDDDKKKQRKERFGIATDNDITKFSAKSLVEKEKKKKRAERFGASKHPRNSKKGKIEKESAKALEGLNQNADILEERKKRFGI
mmetsp:Transcript_14690/g.20493  ORF Transcript_14690/g.20493 Transcript_14690/m.20493 type:complete len:85 (+) Transcript_14690:402-656(+)